jgi:hypothetical protein
LYTPEELKEAGLDDFRVFLIQVWDYLRLPEPTPVQLDIAYHLQHFPELLKSDRFIMQGFRGVGKSWITVAFVLWNLLLNPQLKIMVVSASEPPAADFTKFCKQLIHGMPLLQHLAPREGQLDRSDKFDVGPAFDSKDPSVKSVGITGQLTGSRADIIVADDVETPKNSYTQLLRERLAELVKEFDAVLKPDGRIIYLGTPQIEDSLYNRLAKDRGYVIRIWPAEVPSDLSIYRGRLAPFLLRRAERFPAGTPIEPTRFPRKELDSRKASYGIAGYELQFMLNTAPSDADRNPLKCRNLIIHDIDPDMGHVKMIWGLDRENVINDLHCGGLDGDRYVYPAWKSSEMAKYTGTVMAIDPSGKGKDETAFAIVKYLHGLLYLVDLGGFLDGFGEATLRALAAKAARWGVNYVIAEENYGGGMFNNLLKPHLIATGQAHRKSLENPDLPLAKFDEEWNGWSSTQKELRICDTLTPLLDSHRLVVSRKVIEEDLKVQQERESYSFIQQLSRMARIKGCLAHEDRLEAVAMACGYFADRMDRDQDKTVERMRQELVDAELKKFMAIATGGRSDRGSRGYYTWTPKRH